MIDAPKPDEIQEKPSPMAGIGGLVGILIAIVVGALIGVFYGEQMWLAAGGPQERLETLKKTLVQKKEFAEEAERMARQAVNGGDLQKAETYKREAAKLRDDHVPKIEAAIAATNQQIEVMRDRLGQGEKPAEPGFYRQMVVARNVWVLTEFVGDLFLQVLKLLVIPLVVTSMIAGITSLGDIRKVGKVGAATLIYYMVTAGIAVFIGIMLVIVIKPGKQADDTFAYVSESVQEKEGTTVLETLLNVFRGREGEPGSGMFPSNLFAAASETNVLGLIAFALLFGGSLTTIGAKGKVAIDFFQAANEAVMNMVHIVMYFAPIGIYGLVASKIAENGGGAAFGEELAKLGWYVATVIIGLAIHVVGLMILLAFLARRNPFTYTYGVLRALLTAVSTASSSATLPITMECVEENNGVSNRSASFVLPLGATINMDGTALYEAVAVIFIAQSLGVDLTTGQLVVIFLTATLAAIGAAGIPEAGLVTMVIVLTAVGLPMTGIGTILAIDWFLDRLRTTVNVYGDALGAGIIDYQVVSREAT